MNRIITIIACLAMASMHLAETGTAGGPHDT